MTDISGFGASVSLVASSTFPAGILLTQFADDADPIDSPAVDLAGTAMGLNGDLVSWSTAVPLPLNISLIPNSDDDNNMQILAERNRPGRGKTPARDSITLIVVYPDGQTKTFTNGTLTSSPSTLSIASSGRQKTNTYSFMFENAS